MYVGHPYTSTMILDCPSWLSFYRILELAMREFEVLEENRLIVKGEHLERMGLHLMPRQAPSFPYSWLKICVSAKYLTLLLIGWTTH